MIKYALIGLGITFACLITIAIPIMHFVSVPLSPLIGGWFAGNSAKAKPNAAIGIGVLMGVLMIFPAVVAVVVVATVVGVKGLAPMALSIVVPLYTALLGVAGAMIGGRMAAKS